MKTFSYLLFFCLSIVAFSCEKPDTEGTKEQAESDTTQEEEVVEDEAVSLDEAFEEPTKGEIIIDKSKIEGFESPVALASAILRTMQNEDFQQYAHYVLPIERMEEMAGKIEDPKVRKLFKHEMEFSHEMERDYFVNMIKGLKSEGIKIGEIPLGEVLTFEFKQGLYQPLQLQEILIDIETETREEVLLFVAIKDGDKWYATSELEL